jgi:phage gp29-like protein
VTQGQAQTGSAGKKNIALKTYGVGYSDVAMQLMSSLDAPIRNPDSFLSRYREMAETDETVGAALEMLCYAVVRKFGTFVHPDARIMHLVSRCQENTQGTVEEVRRALLADSLSYGFGVGEFTLAAQENAWLLSSIQVYDPSTLTFKFMRGKDNALHIETIVQRVAGADKQIPAHKCYVARHGAGTNPYGRSRLRRCWRWYAFKRALPKFWAIALERFGMPMLVGKSEDPEALAQILQDAYAKSFASIGLGDSIETVGANSQSGIEGAYSAAVNFCNRMIYRAFFLPALLEGGQQGGSYALGEIHWRMFDDSCLWLARELAEVELETLWRPIIEWNFGPQDTYGSIPVVNLQTPEEQEVMSKIFLNGVNAGVLYPDEGDAAWMRDRLGFPEEIPEGGEPSAWRAKLSRLEVDEKQTTEEQK